MIEIDSWIEDRAESLVRRFLLATIDGELDALLLKQIAAQWLREAVDVLSGVSSTARGDPEAQPPPDSL